MDMTTFFSALAGSAISTGILGILIGALINHRFTLAREAETRAAAAREKPREESRAVAEILAEWIRPAYMGQPSNEDIWRLQTAYWKNILGLDRELVTILLPRLENVAGAVEINEIIVQARRIVLGLAEADLKAADLNNWPPLPKAG